MMEFYESILCEAIVKEVLPSLRINPAELVEMKCYQAIVRIREILADDALDDAACFRRVEELVSELEILGLDGGGRHDFG